ncbi:MAG: hypothetical protein JW920_04140, partial [Deltaproteobacteria bacterium]|nr:hypothetical protein [Deltaproteobacteria bacterium]
NCYVLIHEHCIYPCAIMIDKELFGKVFFDMMCPVNCATDLTIKLCRILDFSLKICEPFHRSPYSGDLAWGNDAETLMLKNLPHYFKRRKEISGLSYIGLIESSIGFKYETIRHHNI